jgi:hypothetical protein
MGHRARAICCARHLLICSTGNQANHFLPDMRGAPGPEGAKFVARKI